MAKILLVEDHPLVQKLCSTQLEGLGHTVVAVDDAESAQRILTDDAVFDLLLSDWSLPGEMDGLELALWVRVQHSGVAVLLMSGYADAERLGGDRNVPVLPKPFSAEELERCLAQLLSR